MIQVILLNIIRGYTTFHESQISLYYGEAYPSVICLSVSQSASNPPLEYTRLTRQTDRTSLNSKVPANVRASIHPVLVLATHTYLAVIIIN